MKKAGAVLISIAIIIIGWAFTDPTDIAERLGKQLSLFNSENPSTTLYLHLDKNVYQPNENIWFKAYVLAGKVVDSKVIYVRLVDQYKKVVVRTQFPANGIRAHGNLLIPAATRNGNYTLYAYTDRMMNFDEHDAFVKPITIRDDASNMLVAEASVADTTKLIRGGKVDVVVKIKDVTGYLKNIHGKYQLLDADTILKTGSATTNSSGEAIISFTYPPLADNRTLRLRASFKRNNDFAEVLLNLHHEGNQTIINTYPEGGHLIAGISNKMVVEAMDINKYPVVTTISLMDGSKAIAHVKTNGQGQAVINFKPAAGAAYSFEIASTGKNNTHIRFVQPVEEQGYSLALRKLNGKTALMLKNKGESAQATLVLRNSEQIISAQQIMVPPGDSVTIVPPLTVMNKQVLSAALFNAEGKLAAERVFLNKIADDYTVAIKTDAASYGMRKKVTLSFDIADSEGKPVEANLSVAVVEKNTIDKTTYGNILNYYYYKALKGNDMNAYLSAKTESDIDVLLITKKWAHNDWDAVIDYTSNGPPKLFKYADGIAGYITLNDSQPDVQVNNYGMNDITLVGHNQLVIIPLNQQMEFYIPSEKITMPKGEEWNMLYDNRFQKAYSLHFYDYDWVFDRKIADAHLLDKIWMFNTYATNKPAAAPKFAKIVQLKEVRIGAKETTLDNDDYFNMNCPDYVCSFGGFYCPRHTPGKPGSESNTSPVIGGIYNYKGYVAEYRGCNDYLLKSIAIPDKFPLVDYDKDPNAEPNFNTTLYWNPNADTGTDGKNILSFFTSLLPGDYTVIAQGVDKKTNKPMYGTATFSVK
jgi:hypothetical protein